MAPIDVIVVTGFLGSGKTTLINGILNDPALSDTAVIVNEFGEISIDHLLVEKTSEEIIEIPGGCLCCTVRGELAETLADLVDRVQTGKISKLSRIIIETTGMADPVPVLHAIQSHPALCQALQIDRVITTLDVIAGSETLAKHVEAGRQIAAADIVVLTKTGLADADACEKLLSETETVISGRVVMDHDIKAHPTDVLETDVHDFRRGGAGAGHDHTDHHHRPSATAHVIIHDQPVDWLRVENFLDLLRSRTDMEILRIKGIVQTRNNPECPIVVQGVQRMLYPPRELARWPDGTERKTVLVVIGKLVDGAQIERLWRAFVDIPQLDTPDRVALEDNPLAIPGAN